MFGMSYMVSGNMRCSLKYVAYQNWYMATKHDVHGTCPRFKLETASKYICHKGIGFDRAISYHILSIKTHWGLNRWLCKRSCRINCNTRSFRTGFEDDRWIQKLLEVSSLSLKPFGDLLLKLIHLMTSQVVFDSHWKLKECWGRTLVLTEVRWRV